MTEKLSYIDGMKGIGALIVYLCHFVFAFFYAAYSLDPAHIHTASGIEIAIGKTPLNLLYNGNFAVEFFLVLSGFVLCIGYFAARDKRRLGKSALKRYFRLVVPVVIVNLLIAVLMKAGLYMNTQAAQITGSTDWFAGFNSFPAKIWEALLEGLFGSFILGSNAYNGVLWTMPYLFLGALVVYLAVFLIGENRFRYLVYLVMILAALKIHIYFAGIFVGLLISDIVYTQEKLMQWYRRHAFLAWIAFAAGLYLASYPSIGGDVSGTIYCILPYPLVVPYHLAGAALIVTGVCGSGLLQKILGCRIPEKLGGISYALYLIHFPVIATFSSIYFLKTVDSLGYGLCVLTDFVLTTAIVIGLSILIHRFVEPLGNRLASRIAGK